MFGPEGEVRGAGGVPPFTLAAAQALQKLGPAVQPPLASGLTFTPLGADTDLCPQAEPQAPSLTFLFLDS